MLSNKTKKSCTRWQVTRLLITVPMALRALNPKDLITVHGYVVLPVPLPFKTEMQYCFLLLLGSSNLFLPPTCTSSIYHTFTGTQGSITTTLGNLFQIELYATESVSWKYKLHNGRAAFFMFRCVVGNCSNFKFFYGVIYNRLFFLTMAAPSSSPTIYTRLYCTMSSDLAVIISFFKQRQQISMVIQSDAITSCNIA